MVAECGWERPFEEKEGGVAAGEPDSTPYLEAGLAAMSPRIPVVVARFPALQRQGELNQILSNKTFTVNRNKKTADIEGTLWWWEKGCVPLMSAAGAS